MVGGDADGDREELLHRGKVVRCLRLLLLRGVCLLCLGFGRFMLRLNILSCPHDSSGNGASE